MVYASIEWLAIVTLETAAAVILEQLSSVRRTAVKVNRIPEPPADAAPKPTPSSVVVTSPHLDALIAAVWKLSRSEAQTIIDRRVVFINGRCIEDADHVPTEEDIISIRGFGRFVYCGTERETRKGRLRVTVGLYLS